MTPASVSCIARAYTMVWVGWQADIPSKPGQLAIDRTRAARRDRPCARRVPLRPHDAARRRATLSWPIGDPPIACGDRARDMGCAAREPAGLAIGASGRPRRVEITRPATASTPVRSTRSPIPRAIPPSRPGLCRHARRGFSFLRRDATRPIRCSAAASVRSARSALASRNPGDSCAISSISASTRTSPARMVFDGLMPHVAGTRRMATNVRFGLPGRNPRHPQDPAWQADPFPFTYQTLGDPLSGRRDGLLQRCRLNATCPRIIQTDSEHEWWASRASLLVTDLAGNHLDLPGDVRAYMIAGTPHFAEPADRDAQARPRWRCRSIRCTPARRCARCSPRCRRGSPPASSRPRAAFRCAPMARWWKPHGAVPRNIPALPYAAHPHRRGLYRREPVLPAEDPRHLSGVRTPRGRRRHGHLRASACCRSPCRARPTPDGIRARRDLAPARCFRCRARSFRSPPRAAAARGAQRSAPVGRRTLRGQRRLCRRGARRPPRGWWPNGCCCRRTPSAPPSLRRRTDCRNCTDGGAGKDQASIGWRGFANPGGNAAVRSQPRRRSICSSRHQAHADPPRRVTNIADRSPSSASGRY